MYNRHGPITEGKYAKDEEVQEEEHWYPRQEEGSEQKTQESPNE